MFNHYFDRAISALRRGEEGEIGFALRGVADFLISNITFSGQYLNRSILEFVNQFSAAQERGDWIRIADMLEFELLQRDDIGNFVYQSVRLTTDTAEYRIREPVTFTGQVIKTSNAELAKTRSDLKYAYHLQYLGDGVGSEYLEKTMVRDFSAEPEWRWTPQGPSGLYRVTLWVISGEMGPELRVEMEDMIDINIESPGD